LGDVILLPGLINAHCHLDYTDMAGQISSPGVFSNWIKAIMALKAGWSYADFAQSWLRGAKMLLRTGTTTVVDVEAVPELLPETWQATPLRVISFREMINLKKPFPKTEMKSAIDKWTALPDGNGRIGLSPHAPYTTTPELLKFAARAAQEHRWRLTTHVAESEPEFEMFINRRGPLFDWLQPQRDMSDCGQGSPVQHLERCGYLSQNLLAVHANYLLRDDPAILAAHKVSVVHCPRSHSYFGHAPFPRGELTAAGVNLCLGTDSLASSPNIPKHPPQLDLCAEMKVFARQQPALSPSTILRMVTINAAAALGRTGELGELSPKALADMIALPFTGKLLDATEAVVHHAGDVAASMIGGRWAFGRA
jgi:cytosine/adenosine deaminase-related metal-dependent hydrolase